MIERETERETNRSYLAVPAAGSGPGVLVLHAWWGLTPFITGLCDRLAEAGFVALAPDLFDGRTAATPAEAEALVQLAEGPNIDRTQALASGSLAQLRAHLAHKFAKWQLPERFEFLDAIPRTSTGKFWKTKLRDKYRA